MLDSIPLTTPYISFALKSYTFTLDYLKSSDDVSHYNNTISSSLTVMWYSGMYNETVKAL